MFNGDANDAMLDMAKAFGVPPFTRPPSFYAHDNKKYTFWDNFSLTPSSARVVELDGRVQTVEFSFHQPLYANATSMANAISHAHEWFGLPTTESEPTPEFGGGRMFLAYWLRFEGHPIDYILEISQYSDGTSLHASAGYANPCLPFGLDDANRIGTKEAEEWSDSHGFRGTQKTWGPEYSFNEGELTIMMDFAYGDQTTCNQTEGGNFGVRMDGFTGAIQDASASNTRCMAG